MHRGRLTRERIGYSMPAVSPLYPKPPIPMEGVEIIGVNFETDLDAVLDILPAPLEVTEPATATIGIAHISGGGMGEYLDARIVLPCYYEGVMHRYDAQMLVTTDVAFALGRELHGAAKKLGHVVMERGEDRVWGHAERPLGCRVLEVSVTLDEQVEADPRIMSIAPSVSLRVIGQPQGYEIDTTIDLIQTPASWQILEQWKGQGAVSFPDSNGVDNWQMLPIRKVLDSFYTKLRIEIPDAKLLVRM